MAIEWAKALVQLADPKANPAGFRMAQAQLALLKQQLYAYGKPWSAEMAKIVGEAPPPDISVR